MKSLKIFLFLGVAIFLFLGAQAWGDVPKLINFQGRLTDGSGTPVKDSTYSVLFTIYDAFTGGTNLWSETQPVATKGGTFNVNLGSATALPDTIFNDTTRYLAMKVGTDPEMTPRQRIVSMGYSYRVGSVSSNEITDEPGVASNANSDGVAITSTALAIILSRTITVPAAGYVLVLGTTQFEVTHVTGTSDTYNIGVSGSSTALPVNQDLFTTVIAALPTGTYQKVVSPHGLFVVSAGANTFYLLGEKVASTSVNATAFDSQLTLVFFPTAYGTVVGTFQNSASEQDDGAIDAPDRE